MSNPYNYFLAVSRNIGWVSLAEQVLLSKKRVAIAGLGGVGSTYLLMLCRLGITKFTIADFDSFGVENFNRQAAANMNTVGREKLEAALEMARTINPEIDVRSFPQGVTDSNIDEFLDDVDVYVDGLDFFALSIRRKVFERAYQRAIPAVTCAPLGMGVSNLNFMPGGMSFEEYFRMEGASETEQYLRFFVGLSPSRLHSAYLVVPEAINLPAKKGPSTIMACELCAGVAGSQILKILLNRGDVIAAPRCIQFDAYRNKFKISWRWKGNDNPINKLAIEIGKRTLLSQAPKTPPRLEPIQDPVKYVLDKARWAPSGDNTQVWQFKITGERTFEIHGHDTRDWVVYDLAGEASNMAHGALIETAAIAATSIGFRLVVNQVNRELPEKPVYSVELVEDATVQADPLSDYIEIRTVQRKPMGTRRLTQEEKQLLTETLPSGYKVHWFESDQAKKEVAKLMFGNALTRLMMKEGYEVHSKIIEWGAKFSLDKIPEQALGVDPFTAKLMKWALKSWERFDFMAKYLGGTIAPRIQLDYIPSLKSCAHFILYSDNRPVSLDDQVAAGRALQRFWLTAARLGLGFQPEQTPVIFSSYLNNGVQFSENAAAVHNAKQMDEQLKTLIPEQVYLHKVFMGRLGRSQVASSRSLRKPLELLLID